MEDLMRMKKKQSIGRGSSEIGIVQAISPHFIFTINGEEYSSEFFTIYVPAVDRIKQEDEIKAITPDEINGTATVEIGDLELEPDQYERRFSVGDLIDVTDRGDSFIVHGRVVKWGSGQVVNPPRR